MSLGSDRAVLDNEYIAVGGSGSRIVGVECDRAAVDRDIRIGIEHDFGVGDKSLTIDSNGTLRSLNGNWEVDSKISALSNLNRVDNISVLNSSEGVGVAPDGKSGDLFSGSGSGIEYRQGFSDFAYIKRAVIRSNKVSPSGGVEVGNVDSG